MYVYFPNAGIASVVAIQEDDTRVEVGLVGSEGMTGTSVVLGTDRSPNETYMQVAGEGQRITVSHLRATIGERGGAARPLPQICAGFHGADRSNCHSKCAGQDRCASGPMAPHGARPCPSQHTAATYEFLALMLGVRRAGVTDALNDLERKKLIRTDRGEIVVLDPKGIQRTAGGTYGTPEAGIPSVDRVEIGHFRTF